MEKPSSLWAPGSRLEPPASRLDRAGIEHRGNFRTILQVVVARLDELRRVIHKPPMCIDPCKPVP